MMSCCKNKFSRKEWLTIGIVGSVHFVCAICLSIQAPFYPKEAKAKNATATEYGLVFGVYELTSFICSPLLGNFIEKIGAKTLLTAGIFSAGSSVIFFGILDEIQNRSLFIGLSFLLRIFEALGTSACVTTAFSITTITFPENVATAFATLELFYGVGIVIGPSIGGVLYSYGGYKLPFITVGCVMLILGAVIIFCLPSYKNSETSKAEGRLFAVLKVPAVLLDLIGIAAFTICLGFYSATLEPHIRRFEMTSAEVGLLFTIHGVIYATTAPFVGRLCDKFVNPRHFILLSCVLVIISVLFVGPAPFIPSDPSLVLVIVGLIFMGFAMSTVMVSVFIDAVRRSIAFGLPDDISTYGVISGLHFSFFCLGDFIGPSVGGVLDDHVGFRWGTLFIVAVEVVVIVCVFLFTKDEATRKTPEKVTDNISMDTTISSIP